MALQILRLPDIKRLSGLSRSSIYNGIAAGTFPKQVRLGPRAVGWPESDISALNAARVRGASDAEIRKLVAELERIRKAAS